MAAESVWKSGALRGRCSTHPPSALIDFLLTKLTLVYRVCIEAAPSGLGFVPLTAPLQEGLGRRKDVR